MMRFGKAERRLACLTLLVMSMTSPVMRGDDKIWFTDMSKCTPGSALLETDRDKRWRAIEYQSKEVSGVLISAGLEAPDFPLQLNDLVLSILQYLQSVAKKSQLFGIVRSRHTT